MSTRVQQKRRLPRLLPVTDLEKRIKLAEAMGWTRSHTNWWNPPGRITSDGVSRPLPDPFTDANDDHAVLQWFKVMLSQQMDGNVRNKYAVTFLNALAVNKMDHKIGDNARAALKVIG